MVPCPEEGPECPVPKMLIYMEREAEWAGTAGHGRAGHGGP